MKVMKFGGACLSNPDNFLKVSEIICSERDRSIIVVSAISGITDLLEIGIKNAVQSEKKANKIIETIRNKHRSIIESTIKNKKIREKTIKNIENKIRKLERIFCGIAYTEEITESIRANALSYGERFSVIVLSGVLESERKKAVALESEKLGIVTDESFENATAILPEVRKNLKEKLMPFVKKGIIPIITGYFGCTKEGKVTTFGRNGSDYSAAVIAYGISSPELEIWKDVDGFMSADPKVVATAKKVDKLSYYEAAELSYFGARVLHPRTVEPLVETNTKIIIRNLFDKDSKGTLILSQGYKKKNVVKSVTFNKNIVVLRVYGPGVGYKPGIIGVIGQILSQKGINIYSILTSQTCINLLIDRKDSIRSYKILKELCGGVIEKVDLVEKIALIAVVGEGLKNEHGIAARVFSAVAKENINVEMISSGASEVASYFIVKSINVEKAINAIHKEFFGKFTGE